MENKAQELVEFINRENGFSFDKLESRKGFKGSIADFISLYDREKELCRLHFAMAGERWEIVGLKATRFITTLDSQIMNVAWKLHKQELTKEALLERVEVLKGHFDTADELTKTSKLTREQLLSRETAFDDSVSGSLKLFRFGGRDLGFEGCTLHPAIVICNTNRSIIESLPETKPGQTRCYVVFKVEKELAYSHFIFAYVAGETKIIATDKTLFATPNIANSTRNPWRKVEEKFDTGMPYTELLDRVEKFDKPVLAGQTFGEVFNIADCKDGGTYVSSMAEFTYQRIIAAGAEIKDVVWQVDEKMKLIGAGALPSETSEAEKLTGWGEASKEVYREITEAYGLNLLPIKAEFSVEATEDADWFDTAESLRKRAVWMALDNQAQALRAEIKQATQRELYDILKDYLQSLDIEQMIPLFTQAKNLWWEHKGIFTPQQGFSTKQDTQVRSFKCGQFFGKADTYRFTPNKPKKSYSRYQYSKYNCPVKPEYPVNCMILSRIHHYAQLAYFLGVNVSDLPKEFRAYRHHSFVPYVGNSILDSVHPLALITDPASRTYPNGIDIKVNLSKAAYRELVKGKPEHMTISFDSQTGEIKTYEGQPVSEIMPYSNQITW